MTETIQNKKPNISPIIGTVKGTNLKVYNWHGAQILTGPGHNTKVLDEFQRRSKNIEQNFFLIVGQPGTGKSYFGLRLCEILDPNFDPNLQIAFDRTKLLMLIGPDTPLKRGSCILIDESQYIAGARNWFLEVQRDLMQHLEAVRSHGFTIVLIALHLSILDKIIRQFVLSHLIKMKKRGSATIFELYVPTWEDKLYKNTLGNMTLQLPHKTSGHPEAKLCFYKSCLMCKYQKVCMSNRAIYERMKTSFLNAMSHQSAQKNEERERRKSPMNINALINMIISKKDNITYIEKGVSKGKADYESIISIADDNGIQLTDAQAKTIVRRGIHKHPEVFKKTPSDQE